MTLITLAFLACMHGACRTVAIPFDGSLQACMLYGQHAIAQWQREHPGWTLARGYRCETGSNA